MLVTRGKRKYKVLVGVPTYDGKNYCWDDFKSRVTSLTYNSYDVLIVENSEGNKNIKIIKKEGLNALRIKPKKKSSQKVLAESHDILRQRAIKGKYDFLLHLESDVFPPLDVIERLISHNKKVVSASYFINFGEKSHLMMQEIEKAGSIRETANLKGGADMIRVGRGLQKVFSCGLGCVLIHRSVLKQIKFRCEDGMFLHPDTLFALDLDGKQIPIYVDTTILCEHRNVEWLHA